MQLRTWQCDSVRAYGSVLRMQSPGRIKLEDCTAEREPNLVPPCPNCLLGFLLAWAVPQTVHRYCLEPPAVTSQSHGVRVLVIQPTGICSLCSKWHSNPVFLTNIECFQDWSWQCRCGDQAGWEEHCCAFHQNGIQTLYRFQDRETPCIQEEGLIMLLTIAKCSKPYWNPWHQSTCCKPFPWVKASMAAGWFLWVSSICTAYSQRPKWDRGAASRSVSK